MPSSYVSCICKEQECGKGRCICVKSKTFCNTLEYEAILESRNSSAQDIKSCNCVKCDNLYMDWSSNIYSKSSFIIEEKGLFAATTIRRYVYLLNRVSLLINIFVSGGKLYVN